MFFPVTTLTLLITIICDTTSTTTQSTSGSNCCITIPAVYNTCHACSKKSTSKKNNYSFKSCHLHQVVHSANNHMPCKTTLRDLNSNTMSDNNQVHGYADPPRKWSYYAVKYLFKTMMYLLTHRLLCPSPFN